MNDLFGEQLLVVVKLLPFLERNHPKVTKAMHAEAARVPKEMRRQVRSFLDDEPAERVPKAAAFDYLRILELLARPVEPADLEELVGSHQEPTDALDLLVPVSRALAFLNGAAARRSRRTLTDVVYLVPSDQEVERFRRAFAAIEDPVGMLGRMRQGRLLADEVAALATVYPALYALLGTIVGEELGSAKARKGAKWNPSVAQEQQLMTLLQMSRTDPGLIADMQATFGEQPAEGEVPAKGQGSKIDLKSKSYRTPGQAAEAGGR